MYSVLVSVYFYPGAAKALLKINADLLTEKSWHHYVILNP